MITIQNQNFGVEIELTGVTRQAAAQVIAGYYGTIGTRFMGTVYKTYEAVDNKGRRWKCMRDACGLPRGTAAQYRRHWKSHSCWTSGGWAWPPWQRSAPASDCPPCGAG